MRIFWAVISKWMRSYLTKRTNIELLIPNFLHFFAYLKNAILTLHGCISVNITWKCSHNTSKFKLNITGFNKRYLNCIPFLVVDVERIKEGGRLFEWLEIFTKPCPTTFFVLRSIVVSNLGSGIFLFQHLSNILCFCLATTTNATSNASTTFSSIKFLSTTTTTPVYWCTTSKEKICDHTIMLYIVCMTQKVIWNEDTTWLQMILCGRRVKFRCEFDKL